MPSGGVGNLKLCPQCGVVKSCSLFHLSSARHDGYNRICKKCARAKYVSLSEGVVKERRLIARAYNGRKQCCGCKRVLDVSAFHKHVYSPNGLRGRCKDCISSYVKNAYRSNGEYNAKAKQRKHARRALLREAFVEAVNPFVLYQRDEGLCGICNEPVHRFEFHIDHIIPISHGGEHSYKNCQIAHPHCNLSKGARHQVKVIVYA